MHQGSLIQNVAWQEKGREPLTIRLLCYGNINDYIRRTEAPYVAARHIWPAVEYDGGL